MDYRPIVADVIILRTLMEHSYKCWYAWRL